MLRLRPYKACDAHTIAGWIKTEEALRLWGSDRFPHFPLTPQALNAYFLDRNGGCSQGDNFYPFVAFDESGVVGHIMMRYTDDRKKVLRFGFVIVDDRKRGKGYGKELVALAMDFAFRLYGAEKVTLGVFDSNAPAYRCYRSLGFVETGKEELRLLCGRHWRLVEMEAAAPPAKNS